MNQQPSEGIGSIVAMILCCIALYHGIKAYQSGVAINLKDLDLFTLGSIEESTPIIHVVDNTKRSKRADFESQQLYLDCIDALSSLGMKKLEAKKKAKMIFSKHSPTPSSVQEFLMIALKI